MPQTTNSRGLVLDIWSWGLEVNLNLCINARIEDFPRLLNAEFWKFLNFSLPGDFCIYLLSISYQLLGTAGFP